MSDQVVRFVVLALVGIALLIQVYVMVRFAKRLEKVEGEVAEIERDLYGPVKVTDLDRSEQ